MTHEREADEEVVLAGGNVTAVVRVGDTVRRAAGPWTPTVHAFIRHLRASGFDLVPEPLGIDDRGREIISLVAGTRPPTRFRSSRGPMRRSRSWHGPLRAFHEASLGLTAPEDARWQWRSHEPPRSSATTTSPRATSCSRTAG
jgi:hypothetical protein